MAVSVLVVEDDCLVRKYMQATLTNAGFNVEAVGTYREARERVLCNDRYSEVLFLDLHLPDGDGVELLREMEVKGKRMPTVVVTGYLDEERPNLPSWVVGELKPFEASRLPDVIMEAIDRSATDVASAAAVRALIFRVEQMIARCDGIRRSVRVARGG